MKYKKTLLVIGLLLLIVVSWFIFNNKQPQTITAIDTANGDEITIKVGYGNGLRCSTYDDNGICKIYVNMYTNSTYNVVVN